MAVTLADLDAVFLNIINEQSDSTTYPTSFRYILLNEAQRKICSGSIVDYQNKQMLTK